jgi:MFS transporter, DHA2 family, multidrug resistance protein
LPKLNPVTPNPESPDEEKAQMNDTPAETGMTRQRMLAVLTVTLATATVSFDSSIPNVALPTITRELGVAASAAVSIVATYQIILIMTLLPFAALAQRIGQRRTLRIGLVLFITGGILCTFARTLPILIALRACQALGAAAVISIGPALIRSLYPPQWLGRGLALNTVTSTAAMALAPTVGGLMLSTVPWYWLFVIGVPTTLASLLLSPLIPESEPNESAFDITGAIYCMASFGLIFGGTQSAAHSTDPRITALLFALGVPVSIRFVLRELRVPVPILPLDLLKQPLIALTVGSAMLVFVAATSLLITLPFRLQGQFGFSTSATGAILGSWALTMMLCAPSAGMLSDRVSATILGAVGLTVATIGAVLLFLLPATATGFDISWRIAVCAAGYAFYVSPSFRLVVNAAPQERVAAAGSLMSTGRMTGQTLGATAAAAMLALGVGQGATPAAIAALLFFVAGVLGVIRRTPETQA